MRGVPRTLVNLALSEMKPGDYIEVDPFTKAAQVSAHTHAKRHGLTIQTRKQENGKLGIWRIE